MGAACAAGARILLFDTSRINNGRRGVNRSNTNTAMVTRWLLVSGSLKTVGEAPRMGGSGHARSVWFSFADEAWTVSEM
jgi:hypothetical protein